MSMEEKRSITALDFKDRVHSIYILAGFAIALIALYPEATLADPQFQPEGGPEASEEAAIDMVFVKGGCFDMGDVFGRGNDDERPVHRVCVDDFYIGKYEVTQRQWEELTGNYLYYFKNCPDCPVENITWKEALAFTRVLSDKTGIAYRLPTEAEWEYAARSGGKMEKWAGTSDELKLREYAWFEENSGGRTHPVGRLKPNGLGLYDMSGNVREWVSDRYHENYYSSSPFDNPKGPSGGQYHVDRGGSWSEIAEYVRTSVRSWGPAFRRDQYVGFRLAATPAKAKKPATVAPVKRPPESEGKWMEIDRMMEELAN
ncbi:MAG: formylglycine-generating enzyme family protein [Deltaproteobacteria bacterium]|nr:formylglycine-generating enzyme family protein [Deltaproteobacteria bacterium]MCL4873613.1 formylglycine-generating enzyme family protein [bacterium]